ncbi:MFS transporter [Marinicrinis sediminis]|uniref:MFS transporter n=1 Tax=Marinicrinis sediminis TaxID=1652465 RepID=A0ABW5R6R7_9BACL
MRSALWLYLFMFVAFFDLHAQYPILTPFAISLGAVPSFIGYIMGMYSITHLPGNMLAGYGVDRFGGKWFIVCSLILAGCLLMVQSRVNDPWELLWIRSISGFVLAFLSPACLAMLAKMATDRVHQSKLMTGNGLVHTLASVVSPAAGAALVAKTGFSLAFEILGWGLIACGVMAVFFVHDQKPARTPFSSAEREHQQAAQDFSTLRPATSSRDMSILFFCIPLALACSQGILFFEVPLTLRDGPNMVMSTGLLFSIVSLGALVSLSMWFLNRIPASTRLLAGTITLALLFFALSIQWPVSLSVTLFFIGMSKGITFPAIASSLAEQSNHARYGKQFAILSIAYSIGAFFGPVIAGELREWISPYFAAFLILLLGTTLLPPKHRRTRLDLSPSSTPK